MNFGINYICKLRQTNRLCSDAGCTHAEGAVRVATCRVLGGNSYKALITIAQVEIDRVVCGIVATGVSRSKY